HGEFDLKTDQFGARVFLIPARVNRRALGRVNTLLWPLPACSPTEAAFSKLRLCCAGPRPYPSPAVLLVKPRGASLKFEERSVLGARGALGPARVEDALYAAAERNRPGRRR